MEIFEDSRLEEIKNYHYLDKIDELTLPEGMETVLRWGKQRETAPLLNIIIPTYKRPLLLKKTIESVLNSQGFSDYQILIVDNEGLCENPGITETEKMIEEINDEKIVYYRNEYNTPFNWNRLIAVSTAKWLCMVHDDDLINSNHLSIMMNILENHKEIMFLGCDLYPFTTEEDVLKREENDRAEVRFVDNMQFMYGLQIPLLGGIFLREKAVELGGFDTQILSGIGDYIFVAKYSYYYGTYQVRLPLYYYRKSGQQISADISTQYNLRISDYYLGCEIARKNHPFLSAVFIKKCGCELAAKIDGFNNREGSQTRFLDKEEILQKCEIDLSKYGPLDKVVHKIFWYLDRKNGRRKSFDYCEEGK